MNSQPNNSGTGGRLVAWISCMLAAASWGLMILTWAWVLTRPRGTFHDMGSMILTFIIMPITLGLWFVGGPVTLALAGWALKQLQSGGGGETDRRVARVGTVLGRLMFWGGVVFLVMVVLQSLVH